MALNTEERIAVLPVLPLRGLVVFPGTVLSFDVGRKKSSAALFIRGNVRGYGQSGNSP